MATRQAPLDVMYLDQGQIRVLPPEHCLSLVQPRASLKDGLLDLFQWLEIEMEVTCLIVQLLVRREKRIVFALLHVFEAFVPSVAILDQAL